jgi:hypothetical protein
MMQPGLVPVCAVPVGTYCTSTGRYGTGTARYCTRYLRGYVLVSDSMNPLPDSGMSLHPDSDPSI